MEPFAGKTRQQGIVSRGLTIIDNFDSSYLRSAGTRDGGWHIEPIRPGSIKYLVALITSIDRNDMVRSPPRGFK